MNATPGDAGRSGSVPIGEDLDGVLGRFKEWAGTQPAKPSPAPSRAGIRAMPAPRKPAEAVREISYEEALRASSHRRAVDLATIDPLLSAPEPVKDGAFKPEVPAAKPLRQIRWPEARFVQAARAITREEPPSKPIANPPAPPGSHSDRDRIPPTAQPPKAPRREASPQAPRRPTPKATPKNISKTITKTEPEHIRHSASARSRKLPTAAEARTTANARKANPAEAIAAPKPHSPVSAAPRKRRPPQPAFRDVLKGAATLAPAAQPAPSVALERTKSASLALRVSALERAHIQTCAAQENLSVSAYLRQCALGVDELRDQVELALGKLREHQARPAPSSGVLAIPAILGRSARRCLRRLRGQSEDRPAFSMR